eukprot:751545-Hanusia_phi.AAC.2
MSSLSLLEQATDKTIRLWDSRKCNQCIKTIVGHRYVTYLHSRHPHLSQRVMRVQTGRSQAPPGTDQPAFGLWDTIPADSTKISFFAKFAISDASTSMFLFLRLDYLAISSSSLAPPGTYQSLEHGAGDV